MLQPAHVDGRSLVILQRRDRLLGSHFAIVARGELEHDGEALILVANNERRVVSEEELARFMLVKPDTRIVECRGYDFFLIEE